MKKKIKELTLEEAKKLCDKYHKQIQGLFQCHECPYGDPKVYTCKLNKSDLDIYGDEEVEV